MLKYIKAIASLVFQWPVYLFVIAEAAIGNLIGDMFQNVRAIEDDYPNLQDCDEKKVPKVVLDDGFEEIDLDKWHFQSDDEDEKVDDRKVFTDSEGILTPDDPYANVVSPTPQYPAKKQEDSGSVGADFNFGPWLAVNAPRNEEIGSKIAGAGAGEIDDEDCDSDIETLD